MEAYGFRSRNRTPSNESWSCTPNGVCRPVIAYNEGKQRPVTCFNPNNCNSNSQEQGCVVKFEAAFEHLQPSPPSRTDNQRNRGSVNDRPKPVEEFFTKVQTEASQPSRFEIPISAGRSGWDGSTDGCGRGGWDGSTHGYGRGGWGGPTHGHVDNHKQNNATHGYGDIHKQNKGGPTHGRGGWDGPTRGPVNWNGPTYGHGDNHKQNKEKESSHGYGDWGGQTHGHVGWNGPTHGHGNNHKQNKEKEPNHGHGGWDQYHLVEGSYYDNDHPKGDKKKEAALWTHDPRWLSARPPTSTDDSRVSKPTNDIDEATEHLKELAKSRLGLDPRTIPSVGAEARNKPRNTKQEPQPNNRPSGGPVTITSREAAVRYGGHLVK